MQKNALSIDVEDWFHILDSPAVPGIEKWHKLPLRAQYSMEKILELLEATNTKATFFWLAWMAQHFPQLVRRCQEAGHEVASHGYGHVLAYEVGPELFYEDLKKSKTILENITGQPVSGFRAAGFGITEKAPWAFEVIKSAGYEYDSSVFPASRGHGGLIASPIDPYLIKTKFGLLPEIPMSTLRLMGKRVSLFGGGYLRLAPRSLIDWGIRQLHRDCRPLVIYLHPREFDPSHPRLPLNTYRKFKSYVNLKSTFPKLSWLCKKYKFSTMKEMVEGIVNPSDSSVPSLPVVDFMADSGGK